MDNHYAWDGEIGNKQDSSDWADMAAEKGYHYHWWNSVTGSPHLYIADPTGWNV